MHNKWPSLQNPLVIKGFFPIFLMAVQKHSGVVAMTAAGPAALSSSSVHLKVPPREDQSTGEDALRQGIVCTSLVANTVRICSSALDVCGLDTQHLLFGRCYRSGHTLHCNTGSSIHRQPHKNFSFSYAKLKSLRMHKTSKINFVKRAYML